eukprot:12284391-Alexandrium_andersonii.AAC.1
MSLRADNGDNPNLITASCGLSPMPRRNRVCSASNGSSVEVAAWWMAGVRNSMKESTCAL